MRSGRSEDPQYGLRLEGWKITNACQDCAESLSAECQRTSAKCRIHAHVTGLADHFRGKASPAQLGFQCRLITNDQYLRQGITQSGQGVERHRPGEASAQRIGHR